MQTLIHKLWKANLYFALVVIICSFNVSCAKQEASSKTKADAEIDLDYENTKLDKPSKNTKGGKIPTVIELVGDWDCLDCQKMSPIITKIAGELDEKVAFRRGIRLDSKEAKKFYKYIDEVPNFKPPVYVLFDKEGKYVVTFIGAGSYENVKKQFDLLALGKIAPTPVVPKTPPPLANDIRQGKPTVVFYYADWCGYCRKVMPYFDEFAKTFENKITIHKVNVDKEKDFVAKYRIKRGGIPYFQYYGKDGKYITDSIGASPKEVFIANFKNHFGLEPKALPKAAKQPLDSAGEL